MNLLSFVRLASFLALAAGTASAAPVSVNLAGQAFGSGRQIHATSGTALLPAANAYNFRFVGTVHGTGLLAAVIPAGTKIGDLVDRISPESSSSLIGARVNPTGTLPFSVIDRTYAGTLRAPAPFSVSVSASLKIKGQITATGQARLDVTNVKLLVGDFAITDSIVFEAGSRLIIDVAPVVQFGTVAVVVNETAGNVTLRVRRALNLSGEVTVHYATVNVTADGNDFTPTSGILTFANGENLKTIVIPILNNSVDDGNRRFRVRLSAPSAGAIIGANRLAFVTILDDDPPQ
jgi:hypothetical protein